MKNRSITFIALSITLFYIQAIRIVFSTLFGFITDQIFTGPMDLWLPLSNLLVVAAFLAPLLSGMLKSERALGALAVTAAAVRALFAINDIRLRFAAALVVMVAAGVYVARELATDRRHFLHALLGALALDMLLRTLGDTYDLGLRAWWWPVQLAWTLGMLWAVRNRPSRPPAQGGLSTLTGLALGAVLFLEVSLLGLPNAMARWTGTPYAAWAPLLLAVSLLPLSGGWWGQLAARFTRVRLLLGIALTLCLVGGYALHGLPAAILLLAGRSLFLLCLTILLTGEQSGSGAPLALGMLFHLVLNFYNAFSFTYPYTLPALRELGWVAYALAGLGVTLGLLPRGEVTAEHEQRILPRWGARLGLVAVAASAVMVIPPPLSDPLQDGVLRLATYNIHYGYDGEWSYRLDRQADAIAESGADVIALQEVDTGRITSYSVDDAYYLARRLNMRVAYLPTVEHLTGIAVLYRGEAIGLDSAYLTSLQEQTGVMAVELRSGLTCFGVWLGLSDENTLGQIDEALAFIGDAAPVCFGGDFNALPDSELVARVKSAGFIDPFPALGIDPPPPTSPAVEADKRIDYVFVRGLVPVRAWVSDSIASDHRLVVTEVSLFP